MKNAALANIHIVSTIVPVVALAVLLAAILFFLLPGIYCRINKQAADIRSLYNINAGTELQPNTFYKWLCRFNRYLNRAGLSSMKRRWLTIFALTIGPLLIVLISWQSSLSLLSSTALGMLFFSMLNSRISARIRQRKRRFDTALFKMYRFIDMQLEAGLKLSDVIIMLPDAVRDQTVKESVKKMAASYNLTADIGQAVFELQKSFGCTELDIFANHLRQSLDTGITGKGFRQMENLLFARYLSYLNTENEKIKTKLLISVLLASAPLLFVLIYPLFQETVLSLQLMFN